MSQLLYEGKAKRIYATEEAGILRVEYKNSLTAGNGKKKDEQDGKGELNNRITALLFDYLAKKGVPSHFIKTLSPNEQLVKQVEIIPLETITRNIATGSLVKRYGIKEGLTFNPALQEFSYKNDEHDDPLVYPSHAVAFGWATQAEVDRILELANQVNSLLRELFDRLGITLVDFKLEFGRDSEGNVLLADEITPDTCRLWDKETGKKLDKDRFRQDLGDVLGAYREILRRLEEGLK